MSNFNYYDELRNGNTQRYISYLNNHYINTTSPKIKVFKLDKKRTKVDELYGEAKNRIYLEPFEIRAIYLDNPWKQMIGSDSMPYSETQDEMKFVCNFDNMVKEIRDMKGTHISDLYIEYTGNKKASVRKMSGVLIFNIGTVQTLIDLSLDEYDSMRKLRNFINLNLDDTTATLEGENVKSLSIDDFDTQMLNSVKLNLYIKDGQYKNVTDIIEMGDVVLTEKFFLYEVLQAVPGGDMGWEYATHVLDCRLARVDKIQLPSNYTQIIKNNEYGIRDKVNME